MASHRRLGIVSVTSYSNIVVIPNRVVLRVIDVQKDRVTSLMELTEIHVRGVRRIQGSKATAKLARHIEHPPRP